MSLIVQTDSLERQVGRRLHHIGFVVSSISETVVDFAEGVAGTWGGEVILDPLQKVRVAFIRPSGRGQEAVLFELVEPVGGNSPVDGFLRRGGGLHHVCFEVEDIEAELDSVRMRGGLMARSPMPAAAFSGRRIAWVYTRRRLLIEYLEK
jgi:methylmalonyl-CoA/ethylmalonyl-CoA epimerase